MDLRLSVAPDLRTCLVGIHEWPRSPARSAYPSDRVQLDDQTRLVHPGTGALGRRNSDELADRDLRQALDRSLLTFPIQACRIQTVPSLPSGRMCGRATR